MIKITMNLPEEVLEKADKRAKQLGISRTAFITTAVSEKLQQADVLEFLPELLANMRALSDKGDLPKEICK